MIDPKILMCPHDKDFRHLNLQLELIHRNYGAHTGANIEERQFKYLSKNAVWNLEGSRRHWKGDQPPEDEERWIQRKCPNLEDVQRKCPKPNRTQKQSKTCTFYETTTTTLSLAFGSAEINKVIEHDIKSPKRQPATTRG